MRGQNAGGQSAGTGDRMRGRQNAGTGWRRAFNKPLSFRSERLRMENSYIPETLTRRANRRRNPSKNYVVIHVSLTERSRVNGLLFCQPMGLGREGTTRGLKVPGF